MIVEELVVIVLMTHIAMGVIAKRDAGTTINANTALFATKALINAKQ